MENQGRKIAVHSFATALAGAISETFGRATGSPWPLEIVDAEELPLRNTQPVQFRLKAEGGLRGECFVELYEPQASELAAKLGAANAAPVPEDAGKALAFVLSSATDALKVSLAPRYGDVAFKVDSVSGLAFGGMLVVRLAPSQDQSGAGILLYFEAELLNSLTPSAAADPQTQAGDRSIHPSNLKLVMDVELNVALRFGQRQLPLREVLDLTSGSVIELDRMVDEPVELLLDGKLVARGEAVIVDGNYGLRVTEIPQAVETHFLR